MREYREIAHVMPSSLLYKRKVFDRSIERKNMKEIQKELIELLTNLCSNAITFLLFNYTIGGIGRAYTAQQPSAQETGRDESA